MAFWVYVLRCADGSYYTGHTDQLELRLAQHASSQYSGYTASRLPALLAYSAEFTSREEALTMELRIKRWSRAKKEAMMRGDWAAVNRLARGKDRRR